MANEIRRVPIVFFIDANGEAHRVGEIKTDPIELNLPKPRVLAEVKNFTYSFRVAGKAAKRLNKVLRRSFKPKTPYQVWGNGYKNVSLRKKIVLKKILTKTNKTL